MVYWLTISLTKAGPDLCVCVRAGRTVCMSVCMCVAHGV